MDDRVSAEAERAYAYEARKRMYEQQQEKERELLYKLKIMQETAEAHAYASDHVCCFGCADISDELKTLIKELETE